MHLHGSLHNDRTRLGNGSGNLRCWLWCWLWCWLLMSGIYVLAVVLVVVLVDDVRNLRVGSSVGCSVG